MHHKIEGAMYYPLREVTPKHVQKRSKHLSVRRLSPRLRRERLKWLKAMFGRKALLIDKFLS